jgi:hypothetical protein
LLNRYPIECDSKPGWCKGGTISLPEDIVSRYR